MTDVVLPRTSGPELAAHLRGMVPRLKVLYMSGYSDSRLDRPGLLKEDMPLIQKPFTSAELLHRVQELLSMDQGRVPGNDSGT